MTKKTVESVEAMADTLSSLQQESTALGAEEMAFYIGAAIESAKEFAARESLKSRTRNGLSPAK